MRKTLRMSAAAGALGGLYALGALLAFWYLQAPESGVPFFPPAGLTIAALLLTPRHTWWVWLTAVGVAEMAVDLGHGQTFFMALGFTAANVVEPLVGAWLVRKSVDMRAQRDPSSRRDLVGAFVLCAVVIGPLIGGIIGGATSAIAGSSDFATTALKWWLGDALGVLVIAVPILAWNRRAAYPSPAGVPELVAIALLAGVVTLVPPLGWNLSIAYAVLPVLMFAALRGGVVGVGLSGVAVAFSANWLVATGRANKLFAPQSGDHALIHLQLFIAVTLLAALAFAIEFAERTRAERVLRAAEADRARAEVAHLNAITSERRAISRDIHDIVGHALNVMILSAAGARRLIKRDTAEAARLLETAEDVGRDAFRDLDFALALVDPSPGRLDRGIGDLSELVVRLQDAGLDVEYCVTGDVRTVPRVVDRSAYRIVQESLTNVAKHAAGAHTSVRVRYDDESVRLIISDTGGGNGATNGHAGRGLVGMRERVAVLGGRIDAGPVAGGGFEVTAELPT